jgi:molecular chaperone GrpE
MGKGNGKTDRTPLDLEHELPPADGGEDTSNVGSEDAGTGTPVVSETERLRAERDSLLDRLARLQAEFDNARKRASREQQDFREFAAADVIRNILPVIDSFERALKAPAGNSDSNDLRNGLELIYRQFQDALQKLGVQPMDAVGKQFDPRVHEAVEMVDTTEAEDHQVLEEFQRGYNYKGRLLRPAMVRVARNSGS